MQIPFLCLREGLQHLVPKLTFNLGKSKLYQNHLIVIHDPAAPLQKQLHSGAFFNSLLHLSQQHHESGSTLFTTGAFSLCTMLWVQLSFLVLPACHSFFHTLPKVFLALPSSCTYILLQGFVVALPQADSGSSWPICMAQALRRAGQSCHQVCALALGEKKVPIWGKDEFCRLDSVYIAPVSLLMQLQSSSAPLHREMAKNHSLLCRGMWTFFTPLW